ncbi:MAG: hypothetical protein FJ296_09895, partial [Planctomycetes bacterium]|nr:hypothetical protein [Planctomycetota bacterium]
MGGLPQAPGRVAPRGSGTMVSARIRRDPPTPRREAATVTMPASRPTLPGFPALAAGPLALVLALSGRAPATTDEAEQLFRERVHPLLEQHCFECHGPQAARRRGGLSMNGLDTLLRGGDSGPALVTGDANASLLVGAVRRTDPDLAMP